MAWRIVGIRSLRLQIPPSRKYAVHHVLHRLANLPTMRRVLTEWRPLARAYFEYRFARADAYNPPEAKKREKIDTAFALVDGFRVRHALEVGCGSGRCTSRLAGISDRLLATDIAWNAIRHARQRTHDAAGVTFRVADLLTDPFPEGPFDLILCSDVLYYLRREQLPAACTRLVRLLEPAGHLLAVHERAESDDGVGMTLKEFGARTVHDCLAAQPGLVVIADEERPSFRATLFRRRGAGDREVPRG